MRLAIFGFVTFCAMAQTDVPMAKPESVGMSEKRLERIHAFIQDYIDTNQISGAVTLTTSALMGPSMISVISMINSLKFLPLFAASDGLVVTPSMRPMSWASLISPVSPLSIKIFMRITLPVRTG